ncbi:Subtilisin-like protease SBT5.4 [Striga hermonthica]|uniref:Subtilisin-like protease SBT5.4 n=1 Tax=Striga hermonthica TaxID=68872 RepID=A0A9N7N7Q4_STRHE|nr:Subtilisin-like protease SBT5.4 [Striga hermonthica]
MIFDRFSTFFALLILFAAALQKPTLAIKKSYIVYLGAHNHGPDVTTADYQHVEDSHTELLSSFLGSERKARDSMFYSYKRNINGFAALLEEEEAAEIAKHPNVVSVVESKGRKLHTTHSWDFLGLEKDGGFVSPSSIWEKARYGEDTIIATLDTGIWPESKSFSDDGIGPIPSEWKGICQFEGNKRHLCNRKLIGARYYNKAYQASIGKPLNSSFHNARDSEGHGTHTLSTAAGSFVPSASVFGVGNGTSKGGSPRARAASYKVCWPPIDDGECFDADIIKAFDVAIDDGVDVLSVSLGGSPDDYLNDGIAIASFHAVRRGVSVVASAGNDGPSPGTVSNVAPWIITVGASTIDREFDADLKLRNGRVLKGTSVSKPLPENKFYPLIRAADAKAANATEADVLLCKPDTLDTKKARGKIVVCLRGENARVEKGVVAARAGAVGMILCNDESNGDEVLSDPHFLPATHIGYEDGRTLFAYLNSTKYPQGLINAPKAQLNTKPAPFMAAFSSRGPNTITPEILKPDIAAPGVDIIASYTEATSPTELDFDHRRTPFTVMSGTSMSCPHVSGVVGLLKTLHPDWSPAAIRSAIMTTARTRDNTGKPLSDSSHEKAKPFAYGSGHIRPNRAQDPGLVYDLTVNDYLDFLCGLGYNETKLAHFTTSHYDCPTDYSVLDFNNPSITVPKVNGSVTVARKVKNVGRPGKYTASIRHPPGFRASVEPNVLEFEKIGEEKVFRVTIKATKEGVKRGYSFGELLWSDGRHFVRSPIVANHNSSY